MNYFLENIGVDAAQTFQQLCVDTFYEAYSKVHEDENLLSYCEQHYSIERIKSILSDSLIHCVVAYHENRPVGFYVIKHHDCPIGELKGGASELKQLYVLADYYGVGIAATLFDDALEAIAKQKNRWIWLVVSDKNQRAQVFYKKKKFRQLGSGPILRVGRDELTSSILARACRL